MKTIKVKNLIPLYSLILFSIMSLVVSCVGDQGVAKNRGIVKDFSTNSATSGCGKNFFILSSASSTFTCASFCDTGTHTATSSELTDILTSLAAAPVTDLKTRTTTVINASAGVCVADVVVETRPTNQIDVKNDFCSCVSGKSDIISDCDAFCALKPSTTQPTLYVNTILSPAITLNTKLGNLYNWCNTQLQSDTTTPQCTLTATDGTNTVSGIPVTTVSGSNSFTANITTLDKNRTWIVKLIESKSSQAVSKEFQLRRKNQVSTDTNALGALKISPIQQYSCLSYSATQNSSGAVSTNNYVRIFYYFRDTPPSLPPITASSPLVVCHDQQLHPGNDNIAYPRLELIPQAFSMWDFTDTRFVQKAENGSQLTIDKMLQDRLYNEYGVTAQIGLFKLLSYPNKPVTDATSTAATNIKLGYIMIPFSNSDTGRSYCPTMSDYAGNQPLLNLLGDYMVETEGLYLAEKEPEVLVSNGVSKVVYGTMFVRESTVKDYGFYIENGLKIKADANTMHTKTISFYWPTSTTADPLTQGGRKTYTVRYPDSLNGNVPTGVSTTEPTTDKRIGCIPKT